VTVAVVGLKGPVRDVLDRAGWTPERRAQVAWASVDGVMAAWGLVYGTRAPTLTEHPAEA
jgi:hypothetical protein